MSGKIAVVVIVLASLIFGGVVYYMQVYGYYENVTPTPGKDVMIASRATNKSEPIDYANFEGIDANSSPIRYRGCFTTSVNPADLAQTHVVVTGKDPRVAPHWFDCFDAVEIGAALEAGTSRTFMGTKNIEYGVDRVIAITDDGRGFIWHELNICGEIAYDGTSVGEECPPRQKSTKN